MKIIRLLILVFVSLFAAGCANSTAPEQPAAKESELRLIPLAVGGCQKITLEENMTTGYQWTAKYDPKLCKAEITHCAADSELCGAPGQAVVLLSLLTDAPAEVVLEYRRPWEKDTPPVKTVRCRLISKANTAAE